MRTVFALLVGLVVVVAVLAGVIAFCLAFYWALDEAAPYVLIGSAAVLVVGYISYHVGHDLLDWLERRRGEQ